jgi:hypothetical protein
MAKYTLTFLLFFASHLYAEDIVAILDMKFVKDTKETATLLCFGDNEEDCAQWATFYLYDAKVKKVLSGELPSKKIKVIYGRHALMPKNFKNVAVVMTPLQDHKEAEYQIKEWGELKEMYCFKSNDNQPGNVIDGNQRQPQTCYENE